MSTVTIARPAAKAAQDPTPPRRKPGRPRKPDQPIQPLRKRPGPKSGGVAGATRDGAKRDFLREYFRGAGLFKSYLEAKADWEGMKSPDYISNPYYYCERKLARDDAALEGAAGYGGLTEAVEDDPGVDDGDGPDGRDGRRFAYRTARTVEGLENLIDHAIEAVIYAVADGTLDEARGGVARRRLRQARRALYGRELDG